MKLTDNLVSRLKAKAPGRFTAYLTTVSLDGRPNVLPLPFTDVVNDELILFPDLFAQKSKVNLNENTRAALSFADDETGVVLEGVADIVQWGHPPRFRLFGLAAGEVLEKWGDWDEAVEPVIEAADEELQPSVYAQRGVIVFKPEKIVEGLL